MGQALKKDELGQKKTYFDTGTHYDSMCNPLKRQDPSDPSLIRRKGGFGCPNKD